MSSALGIPRKERAAATGTELHEFTGHTNWVNSAVFSPDGRFAVSGSNDNTLRLWMCPGGRKPPAPPPRDKPFASVAFARAMPDRVDHDFKSHRSLLSSPPPKT
ncbi:MAG: WD40 repeat domain-containing protein [Rhodomicrobium sp.]